MTDLAPHGGCNWKGCTTCFPDSQDKTGRTYRSPRRHRKSLDAIKQANSGKVLDWHESDDPSVFETTRWGNVQIDPNQVKAGDILLLALKEDILVGSHKYRLIANWNTITVRVPEECTQDGYEHAMSVCTQCIHESWLWDYLFRNVRTLRNFAHGTYRAYDFFGCRCDTCLRARVAYLNATLPAEKMERIPVHLDE